MLKDSIMALPKKNSRVGFEVESLSSILKIFVKKGDFGWKKLNYYLKEAK